MASPQRLVEPRAAGCTGRGPQRSRVLPVVEEEMELKKKIKRHLQEMQTNLEFKVSVCWGRSRISQRGGMPTYYSAKFCGTLHENEETWTGDASKVLLCSSTIGVQTYARLFLHSLLCQQSQYTSFLPLNIELSSSTVWI